MSQAILNAIREAGVVGAGGAGFPTHVKVQSKVEIVVANGSECEPLLQSDQSLMAHYAGEILRGQQLVMEATGASEGIVALKAVYTDAIAAFNKVLPKYPEIRLHTLGSFYPSGDEQTIVYEATGRIVPEGGIPLNVGVLCDNVETLYNIAKAWGGAPVTHRTVTVLGEVRHPGVWRFPIGTKVSDAIQVAGGTELSEVAVIDGGPMMGAISFNTDGVIRKTTSALIITPKDHPHVVRRALPVNMELIRTISMCCQCRECTDLCPRYQLGHDLEPHKVMRAVITRSEVPPAQLTQAHICCLCGICETVACPLGLSPRNVFAQVRQELRSKGVANPHHRAPTDVRFAYPHTKIPKERVLARCQMTDYYKHLHYEGEVASIKRVEIPMQQHIGAPSCACVKVGDAVNRGQLIASIPEGKLGANLHASISGVVTSVTASRIVIEG